VIHLEKCVVCGKSETQIFIASLLDDRFGYPHPVTIFNCQLCNHFFCIPKLMKDEISDLYERYYGRTSCTKIGEHRTLNSKFWRWVLGENNLGQFALDPSCEMKLLDVGSGDCQNLWDADYLGFNAYGFDVDRTSEQIALLHGLRVLSGDSAAESYKGTKFDFIQLNQVIEHFIDPAIEIQNLKRILSSRGLIYISTPNSSSIYRHLFGKRWINWHVPYHQHHFSKKSLRKLMDDNNLIITRHRTVTPIVWVSLQLRNFRISHEPGVPNKVWSSVNQGKHGRLLELLALAVIFLPVRLLDILKFGDCQVVIVRQRT
jgi:2-polyprenyl-3-methyl-5-hydroxy-6-metoxy-1,4-benzoquinol methylase